MASITASMLIGNSHTDNDGIVPTHSLFLSENSRPALILFQLNLDNIEDKDNIIWIPTINNLMEDILLMVSINILKDEKLGKEFGALVKSKKAGTIELAQVDPDALKNMYKLNKKYLDSHNNFKIALSVFDGSTLERQLPRLKDYSMDIEVCKTSYLRQYSPWKEGIYKKGKLQ